MSISDPYGHARFDPDPALPSDPDPKEPRTELGYAKRLVKLFGARLRYVPAWRRWLIWDGTRWAVDDTGQAARWTKVIARRIYTDALAIMDDKERKEALMAARRGESSAGVAGVLTLAGTEETITVTPDQLDVDPFLVNCTNGTLDLRTGQRRAHDPNDLLTKMAGAAYHSDVTSDVWDGFLGKVQPDPAVRAFLARLFGHALEGRVVEHLLAICHGDGANGKGTFMNAVLAALGDYGDAADPDLLTARTFDAHPTGVADLFGLRLALLHETDANRRLAEGTVKRLTGGDRLKARRMREDFWHFDPSHTFVILTNYKPIVTGIDEGIWRRLRLVPWPVVVPAAERDEHLGDRLKLHTDAVLAWLVAGYRDWHEHGLGEPKAVTAATAAYRSDSDPLRRFLGERCLRATGYRIRSAELFSAWCKWCADEGEETGTNKAMTTALTNRGFDPPQHTNRGAEWQGITLQGDGDGL